MITKMEERIKYIKAMDETNEEEGDTSMRAFGNYNAIRNIFRSLMGFFGGYFCSKMPIRFYFFVLGSYPIVLIIFTLVVFKEERVSFFFKREIF